ncbi:MAG: GLPGLI family protein [Oscillospiraceae bacterium]|nr:GLPGLI family protein [Oscillospiraceae bacterium]
MKTKLFSLYLLAFVCVQKVYPKTLANECSDSDVLESASIGVIYSFSQIAKKDRADIFITDTMALTIGKNCSVYYDWNKKRRDSINSKIIPIEKVKSVNVFKDESLLLSRLERMQEPTFISDESKGESERIYKSRTKGEILTIDIDPSEERNPPTPTYLQVIEFISPQEWTISEDTLTVLGYTCLEAVTTFRGRNYKAWFTLDIPVNKGPWKLYGLPGMILKVEDDDGVFRFQAIGISQISHESIKLPTDRKIVPSSLKQLDDYRKNRFKELTYGFFEDGTSNMFRWRNPLTFQ